MTAWKYGARIHECGSVNDRGTLVESVLFTLRAALKPGESFEVLPFQYRGGGPGALVIIGTPEGAEPSIDPNREWSVKVPPKPRPSAEDTNSDGPWNPL